MTLRVGQTFDHNLLVEALIYRSGVSEVYRARDKASGQLYAIKLTRSNLAGQAQTVKQFEDEKKALLALRDPALVRHHSRRLDPATSQVCIAMEYIEGPSLAVQLQNGKLPLGDVWRLGRRLARGLGALHAANIYHSDISASNILLRGSKVDQAVLIDFATTKAAMRRETTSSRGTFKGSIHYASPEHFTLDQPVEARSDFYSLGLVLAHAAVGRMLSMGQDDLSAIKARMRVPDLSAVPVELHPVLTALLQPAAGSRPPDAEAVLHLMEQYGPAEDRPQEAQMLPPRTEQYDNGKLDRTGRRLRFWHVLLVAVLALGLSGGLWWASQQGREFATPADKTAPTSNCARDHATAETFAPVACKVVNALERTRRVVRDDSIGAISINITPIVKSGPREVPLLIQPDGPLYAYVIAMGDDGIASISYTQQPATKSDSIKPLKWEDMTPGWVLIVGLTASMRLPELERLSASSQYINAGQLQEILERLLAPPENRIRATWKLTVVQR